MPELVQVPLPFPAPGELALTLNLPPEEVDLFLEEERGRCFWSRDQPGAGGEGVARNIERLYAALGVEPPARFASLALRTNYRARAISQTLGAYGSLVLKLDLEQLGPGLVIVNGDFKDVASKIQTENDNGYAFRVAWTDRATVARELAELCANTTNPAAGRRRILGSYIEARLQRALVRDDILSVHVDPGDGAAVAAARRLCGA